MSYMFGIFGSVDIIQAIAVIKSIEKGEHMTATDRVPINVSSATNVMVAKNKNITFDPWVLSNTTSTI